MIRCIVIDDEPLAVRLLSNYVNDHPDLELAGSFNNPIKAFHELDSHQADLIFLDIQMPQLSGMQFLQLLNNRIPVILTTAYNEYALESYDHHVIDYLVKPISYDRFAKSIDKFQSFQLNPSAENITEKEDSLSSNSLFVKSGHKMVRIELNEIRYLESRGDYLHIFTGDEPIKTLENLKDIIQRLSNNFLRCHRSFICNMDKVEYIENNRIIINGNYIPISRAYTQIVQSYVKDRTS
ncbi:MAG: LytTR family DNA-binding domain-containing protein [Saprospiraceae bacterium]|nr:LytTR family DNA-binding domain-containing protein [Saprospiraceae bacterium]